GLDRSVHVWDVQTGKELAGYKGHSSTINSVAFSPDGKQLASASGDTTALVWDVAGLTAPAVAVKALPAEEIETRWAALLSNDGGKAFEAICDLSASPKEAVALLAQHLKPAEAVEPEVIAKLIADLDSDQYKLRQKAHADLLKIGERAVPAIEKALSAQPPLETKTRLETLREKMTTMTLQGDKLQACRAIEVLERIGSPEARQALQALADGAPGAFSTMTAQAA